MNFLNQCLTRLKALTRQLLAFCLPRLKGLLARMGKKPALAANLAALGFCAVVAICVLASYKTETPATPAAAPITGTVGVSLATPQNSTLSILLTQQLEDRGFTVALLCADGNAATQKGQLQTLFASGVSCLIVQPVDSLSLLEPLALAKEKNIPVITCDAMLMDTDWVWGYVGFDYYTLGKLMARKIVESKDLDNTEESFTIEFFMGAPESQSSLLLYNGAMEILSPYLRSGKLKTCSSRTYFEDTYTAGTTDGARESCALRLKAGKPDIVFAGSDEIAEGCRQALTAEGYETDDFPIIIGQGGSGSNAVTNGTQLCTFVKPPIVLAEACAECVVLALSGKKLPDTTTQNNHVLDVPTKLLPTSLVEN